jgi:hypothetical protein
MTLPNRTQGVNSSAELRTTDFFASGLALSRFCARGSGGDAITTGGRFVSL